MRVMADDRAPARASYPLLFACAGAVAGAGGAVYRALTLGIGLWGWRGMLDFPLLAGAAAAGGAIAGALLALVLRRRSGIGRRPALRLLGALLAALLALFVWVMRGTEPGPPAVRPLAGPARPPDVIVVVYDAVRADVLGDAQGEIAASCPRLRAFAARSVTFRNAFAPGPWTVPSHGSLFTGRSPLAHGASAERPILDSGWTTLAEALAERGYATVALVANPWLASGDGFAQGFAVYRELWRDREVLPLAFRLTGRLEQRGLVATRDPRFDKGARVGSVLAEEIVGRLDPETPLFLFVNLVEAHPPYRAPGSDYLRFVPPALLASGPPPERVSQEWTDIYTGKVAIGDRERAILRALNEGEVAYLDRELGRLLDLLERRGRLRDALVAVTSDHGAGLAEDRVFGSGIDLREEMLRIPLVLHLPADRDAGSVRDDLAALQDLYPTALEIAGAAPGAGDAAAGGGGDADGRSLLRDTRRRAVLASYSRPLNALHRLRERQPGFDASPLDRRLLAARGPRWKLLWSSAGPPQLFDLAGAGEAEDVAAREPAVLAEQLALLESLLGCAPEEAWRRFEVRNRGAEAARRFDADTDRSLRALGYTGN